MSKVIHEKLGKGSVIRRESLVNGVFTESQTGSYLTVRFDCGKELRLAIPASFENGRFAVEGELRGEIESAMNVKTELDAEKKTASLAGITTDSYSHSPFRAYSRKNNHRIKNRPVIPVGSSIEDEYRQYLIDMNYKVWTPSGAKSTVFCYVDSIRKQVLTEEGISWDGLKNNIGRIISSYDVGGAKEHIGARSNNTVICALRCFRDFVNL